MRDFRDETERAVWAATFARGDDHGSWTARGAEKFADYVLDRFRELKKPADPYRSADKDPLRWAPNPEYLLDQAVKAVRRLAARMPETPPAGECGDQSRLYYENLADALEEWRERLFPRTYELFAEGRQ